MTTPRSAVFRCLRIRCDGRTKRRSTNIPHVFGLSLWAGRRVFSPSDGHATYAPGSLQGGVTHPPSLRTTGRLPLRPTPYNLFLYIPDSTCYDFRLLSYKYFTSYSKPTTWNMSRNTVYGIQLPFIHLTLYTLY